MQGKLTDSQVRAIHHDMRQHTYIARDYGISRQQVCQIKKRQAYKHVRRYLPLTDVGTPKGVGA